MGVVLEKLVKDFRRADGTGLRALDNVDLDVRSGEIVSLVGSSGCGKTTVLNILAGLVRPSSGKAEVTTDDSRKLRGRIAYVFQSPRLLPWRTVAANVRLVLRPLQLADEEVERRVQHYLEAVGLEGFEDAFPGTLSGGMQQRVAVARAFATGAETLLMDEPFASVDELTARQLRNRLEELWRNDIPHPTILFVTHNIAEAVHLSDRVVVMSPRPGRITAVVDIGLPRPRRPESVESIEYQQRLLSLLGVE